jgi:hypothetical protein
MGDRTTFCNVGQDKDAVMTGEERYPIISTVSLSTHTKKVMLLDMVKMCKGLNLYWNCLEKALIVRNYFRFGYVVLGSLYVYNENRSANYGYEYRPPFEFHAWWQDDLSQDSPIIDIALPGVILKGKSIVDEFGSILSGREPCILVGRPLDWMEYKPLDMFKCLEED